jgi:glycosyltransferase involved in cell wall biosynthesis
MKILHILAGVPPGSGMAESVPTLCRYLRQRGHEVTLATLDGPLSEAAQAAEAAGVRLVRFAPSFPRVLYFSWQMLRGLSALARTSDVVHVNGAWTFPVWWGCRCALRARKPLVMSPRGALNPVYLKHSAWKKRLAGWLDRACLRRAAVVHVTSEAEREWIRNYLPECETKIAVVPNGVELPGKNAERRTPNSERRRGETGGASVRLPENAERRTPNSERRRGETGGASVRLPENAERRTQNAERRSGERKTVLYLGRLHPLKGLDLLVEAWRSVRSSLVHYCDSALVADDQQTVGSGQSAVGSDSTHARMNSCTNELLLVIAGPDEQGTLKALKEQVARLGLEASVKFAGPVYGEEKWRMLRSADVFVLPSRSENFGIVVAEALACSVPVICTKGAPWSELQGYCDHAVVAMTSVKTRTGRAGWWVDVGVEPLAEALREAMALTDEERWAMGQNGRRLVEEKYRWEAVAEQMVDLYTEIQACTV